MYKVNALLSVCGLPRKLVKGCENHFSELVLSVNPLNAIVKIHRSENDISLGVSRYYNFVSDIVSSNPSVFSDVVVTVLYSVFEDTDDVSLVATYSRNYKVCTYVAD